MEQAGSPNQNGASATAAEAPGSVPAPDPSGMDGARQKTLMALRVGLSAILSSALAAALMVGLVWFGLFAAPVAGASYLAVSVAENPPRRSPIVPPMVPQGAREDWAVWTYVDKINQAWGKDWPLVIQWFEELDARYPGNPMVLDKLYVSYLEDGRRLYEAGDLAGARLRYDQAAQFDPDRGIAQELLDELDALEH